MEKTKETLLTRLDELIPVYSSNKSELDDYKKICEKENAEIKSIMTDLELRDYICGEYKAVKTIQHRETMNEQKLLEIAHHYGISEIVKTKEYIDFDTLESAIYTGKISEEVLMEMNKAKDVKEVVTLKVSKIKSKKKKED